MVKAFVLIGVILLMAGEAQALPDAYCFVQKNGTWCTRNEKLAEEYSALIFTLNRENQSFYEFYVRNSDYVQTEAIWRRIIKNDQFYFDKLIEKNNWWLKFSNETELHKLIRAIYEEVETQVRYGLIVDRDILFRTDTILDYGKGVCLQRAEVATAFLRAAGIPTKMVNYLALGSVEGRVRYDAQAIYWNGSEWKQILKDWEGQPITFEWVSV